MLGYCQCSFVAVVPSNSVSLGYVNLAPCALKVVEVSVYTCISRSLGTGDCLPIEQSSHFNYLIFCIDVVVKPNREYSRLYLYYHVWLEIMVYKTCGCV